MKKFLLTFAIAGLAANLTANAQAVLSQNFESGIAPWTNTVTGGGAGWAIATTATTTQLGTIPAHTKYAVLDESLLGSGSYNNPAILTSPTFSLVGVTSPYLVYDYLYFQAYLSAAPHTHEAAWIQMSTDGGATYSLVDSIPGATTSPAPWGTKFVSLSSFSATASCKLQVCYKDNGAQIIGCAVDNIMVFSGNSTDLGITSVTPIAGDPSDYFLAGGTTSFGGTVTNYNATTDITSFQVTYKVGTSAPVTSTVSTTVPHLGTATFSAPTPYTVGTGQFPVQIWVKATGDANVHNDSAVTAVVGVPFMPKKRILFEEATGTWCGWCVRGIVYMDSLWRADSNNVSIVSVHNSDPMQSFNSETIAYDVLTSGMISGFPSMIIDRRAVSDPSSCFSDYSSDNTMFGFANMGLTTSTSGSDVTAHVKIEPAVNMSGDYRLELIVTEDEVSGPAGSSWDQHNYYSGGSAGAMATIGYDFATLPNPVPNVKFPFVARYTIPNDLSTAATKNGVAGSLPSFMHFGVEYSYDFPAYTIPSGVVAANLRYTVLMIDNNSSNATYGYVLNSVNSSSHPAYSFTTVSFVGVKDVTSIVQNVEVFPNPTSEDAHIRFELSESAPVTFAIYDMVGRQVFSVPTETFNAGNHQINISTADLAAGLYNVVIRTDRGTETKRLSVVK